MSEPFDPTPPETPSAWHYAPELDSYALAERQRRASLLRRLRWLLIAGAAAFALTTWLLVRIENPANLLPFSPGPTRVVRAHLEALNRGEFREAYLLFSEHYRKEVPFELYHELVVTHREIFRTRVLSLNAREDSLDRAVLQTHLVSSDGERYLARFSLVRAGGRWWIDDVRWGSESDRRNFIAI